MSQIMEKTLASLPKILSQGLGGGSKSSKIQGPKPLSPDVANFMKAVHRARTKTQEAAVVNAELKAVQEKLRQADFSGTCSGTVRGAFTTSLFCYMLGHDISFLSIHAMKLSQQGKGFDKHIGYLTSCLLLHRSHEMALLMMSTIMSDLQSRDISNIGLGLLAAGQLVEAENIPHLLPAICSLLNHSHPIIRTKTVHCLRAIYQIAPHLVRPILSHVAPKLTSKDPGEITALVCLYGNLSMNDPGELLPLGDSFLHILHSVLNKAFPSIFTHRGIALPWLTISLIKLLGNMAALNSHLACKLAIVLEALLQRTRLGEPTSLAILQETVLAASKLKAGQNVEVQARLLQLCSTSVGKLLSSEAPSNQRWQGLVMLTALAKRRPAFAAHHQVAVVQCLTDSDPIIQRRTTALLHAMANTANVRAVTKKLLEQARGIHCDDSRQRDIFNMVSDLAERLISDPCVYVHVYLDLCLQPAISKDQQEMFSERVLLNIEMLIQKSDSDNKSLLLSLAQDMLVVLQDDTSNYRYHSKTLALQILACLGSSSGLLDSKCQDALLSNLKIQLSQTSKHETKSAKDINIMISPLQEKEIKMNTNSAKEIIDFQCYCLQSVMKMVLAGGLTFDSVKTWLRELDTHCFLKHHLIQGYLDDLKMLMNQSCDSSSFSQIDASNVDLSFSFLDELVVQNLLLGKETLEHRIKQMNVHDDFSSTSNAHSPEVPSMDSSILSLTQSEIDSNRDKTQTKKLASSFRNRWMDDNDDEEDEEEFTLVNVDNQVSKEIMEASELFAGLDVKKNLLPSSCEVTAESKTGASIWSDDNRDDLSINVGFNLHPFGLPHKIRGSGKKWFDHDTDLDFGQKEIAEGFSCLSEYRISSPAEKLVQGASYQPDYRIHDPLNNTNSIYSEHFEDVEVLPNSPQSDANLSVLKIEAMSTTSTVDTLTDSDPDS